MKSTSERRLVLSSFVFAVAAILMAILPFALIMLSDTRQDQQPGDTVGMILGYTTLTLVAVTWVGSFVLFFVNVMFNRSALRSKLGIATIVLNLGVFLNALLWVVIIMNDMIG
jgi:hypothetical protein